MKRRKYEHGRIGVRGLTYFAISLEEGGIRKLVQKPRFAKDFEIRSNISSRENRSSCGHFNNLRRIRKN